MSAAYATGRTLQSQQYSDRLGEAQGVIGRLIFLIESHIGRE